MQISRMLCCKISLLLQSVWRSSVYVCGGRALHQWMDERATPAPPPLAYISDRERVRERCRCRVWSHFKQPLSSRRPWTFSHRERWAKCLPSSELLSLSGSGQTPLSVKVGPTLESKCKHVRNELGNCSCVLVMTDLSVLIDARVVSQSRCQSLALEGQNFKRCHIYSRKLVRVYLTENNKG